MEQGPTYGLDWSVTGSTALVYAENVYMKFGRICLIQSNKNQIATLISLTVIAFITVSFLHLRWSFYLKIECVLISFWDLFHSKTAANTHKRKKKLFKTLRLYLVHKALLNTLPYSLSSTWFQHTRWIWEVHLLDGEREIVGRAFAPRIQGIIAKPQKSPWGKKKITEC